MTRERVPAGKTQRAEEFRIMREDVFHTDKAVAVALERLKAKKTSKAKLETFEQHGAFRGVGVLFGVL